MSAQRSICETGLVSLVVFGVGGLVGFAFVGQPWRFLWGAWPAIFGLGAGFALLFAMGKLSKRDGWLSVAVAGGVTLAIALVTWQVWMAMETGTVQARYPLRRMVEHSFGLTLLCGGSTVVTLMLVGGRDERLSQVIASTCGLTVWAIAMTLVWYRGFRYDGELAMTGIALAVCGLFACLLVYGFDRRPMVARRGIGLLLSLVSFLYLLSCAWEERSSDSTLEMALVLGTGAGTTALDVWRRVVLDRRRFAWQSGALDLLTIVSGAAMGISALLVLVWTQYPSHQLLARVLLGTWYGQTVGALVVVLLVLMSSEGGKTANSVWHLHSADMVCPGCGTLCCVSRKASRCAECGMGLRVEIVEPRCGGCDYSLLGQRYEQCPECGEAVG